MYILKLYHMNKAIGNIFVPSHFQSKPQ